MSFPDRLPVLPQIDTMRLLLRSANELDVDALYEIYSNQDVVRYLDHSAWTEKNEALDLIYSMREGFQSYDLFGWCVVLKDTNRLIGTCVLRNHEHEHKKAEIAFEFHPDYWGKGLLGEVLPVIIKFGFENLQLNRIWADVDPRNVASLKALKKVGFRQEGYLRECWIYPGQKPSDTVLLAVLKSDIENLR